MNITFLVNRDIHACIALNILRPMFNQHRITIFMSENVGKPKQNWQPCNALKQLKYIEQAQFNDVFSPLVEKQSQAQHRYLTFSELGAITESCLPLENMNQPKNLDIIRATKPDLIISIRYGCILKDAALNLAPLGVINLHSGVLPHYQGILSTLHTLIANEDCIGCTLHYIDSAAIDAGNIIDISTISVDMQRSLLWHISSLYPIGCEMIKNVVSKLESGNVPEQQSQNKAQQRYFGLPENKHFNELKKRGFNVWEPSDAVQLYSPFISRSSSHNLGSQVDTE